MFLCGSQRDWLSITQECTRDVQHGGSYVGVPDIAVLSGAYAPDIAMLFGFYAPVTSNAMLFGVYAPVDSKHTAPVVANAVRGLCSGGQLLQCWAHGDESLSDAGFFLAEVYAPVHAVWGLCSGGQ